MDEAKPIFKVKIKVVGIGGGGNNALNTMIREGIRNVEFIAINTDIQALKGCLADRKVAIGSSITKGLGAGNDPEIGMAAAQESSSQIGSVLEGADVVFVTAGKGGGTGTGAAPVVARIAKELSALTIGVVTKPFYFEGKKKMEQAISGIENMAKVTDTLIIVSNDKLLEVKENAPVLEALRLADRILCQAVQAITELVTEPGLINVDFAHVKNILSGSGNALIGIGLGSGENRAKNAAENAITSPLLESSIDGAHRVILNVFGGSDLTLYEVNEVAETVAGAVDPDANMVFGAVVNKKMEGKIKVIVVAAGFKHPALETYPDEEKSRNPSRLRAVDAVDLPTFLRNR